MNVLGISAYYHDSAAALLIDGEIVAAAQEERFTRRKHDAAFPRNAVLYCLQQANLDLQAIDHVVFYDKPFIKFERLLETYIAFAPRGLKSFLHSMPVWIKEKLFLKTTLRTELAQLAGMKPDELPRLFFTEHHQSHAASAFFPSPFEKAAVLCMDGVGEWATTSVWKGEGNQLTPLKQINFPHSLGLLYSAFTYYCGFRVNSGEYKLMGLAPYGEPRFADLIREKLVDCREDGSFRLDMRYFEYATGLTMTNRHFDALFDGPPRKPESELTQKEMDLAASIQQVIEEIVLKIARHVRKTTGLDKLCLAGGVALNCVSNGKLLREGVFNDLWIQPAAGDAGGAVGAAMAIWHQYLGKERRVDGKRDRCQSSLLGPSFSEKEIRGQLDELGAVYEHLPDQALLPKVANELADEKVVGWFDGRMEFGPRALGARSILGDARSPAMQSTMNLKIKYRESFRPFAPIVKADKAEEWFELDRESPYMLLVCPVNKGKRLAVQNSGLEGLDRLKIARSEIPAVTHVDHSARVQTVNKELRPRIWELLDEFEQITRCPVLINTSFNVRGEPIVCSPTDAYRCFMRTDMDTLVIGPFLLHSEDQPGLEETGDWQEEFELD